MKPKRLWWLAQTMPICRKLIAYPQVRWPLFDERPEERRSLRLIPYVGHADLYDKQRHRDGEHPIAEGLDPARVVVAVLVHAEAPLAV